MRFFILSLSVFFGGFCTPSFSYAAECGGNWDLTSVHFTKPVDAFENVDVMGSDCGNESVIATVGTSEDDGTLYIWKEVYYTTDGKNLSENKTTLNGTLNEAGGNWIIGKGTVDISAQAGAENYFAAYMCRYINDDWHCGCKDENTCSDHTENLFIWHLEKFNMPDTPANDEENKNPDNNQDEQNPDNKNDENNGGNEEQENPDNDDEDTQGDDDNDDTPAAENDENIDTTNGALLRIPARQQWQNSNGYCGANTIQSVLLYFGGYASQDMIRKTIGNREINISYNDDGVYPVLKLDFEAWNEGDDPEGHLAWMKEHLSQGHPVLGTVFEDGGSEGDYDHIIPFIGYESTGGTEYNADDVILYNPLQYGDGTMKKRFADFIASRQECNGNDDLYCLPSQRQYAKVSSGITDTNNETFRARLDVDRDDEPNVSTGENPVTLNGTLYISGLTPGESYSILRYNDYDNLPENNFLNSDYSEKTDFVAAGAIHTFADTFSSGGVAIYRVVTAE